ncbi:MAG: hypothetical protein NC311_09380 [Muribaculaceae bacterium]|nr:hypothetical protein [Muribaculaceae bacterium]
MNKLNNTYIEKVSSRTKTIYFLIFIAFIVSMRLWIGWNGREANIYMLLAVALLALSVGSGLHQKLLTRDIISLVIWYIVFAFMTSKLFAVGNLLRVIIIGILLTLDNENRVRCFRYITKWFALLMIPSLIMYWVVQLTHIPPLGILILGNNAIESVVEYSIRYNYLFYAYSSFYGIRFNGPFLEPGHLGMISAFILTVNHFDLKNKYNFIIFVALLHTFSLAGYVLAFIGFWLVRYYDGKLKLQHLVLYIGFFLGFFLFSMLYNGGDNLITELIFDRLQLDNEKGFSGNNRSGELMAYYYLQMWNDPHLLFYGYDAVSYDAMIGSGLGGSGYTKFVVQHGLLGVIIASLFYLLYLLKSTNKKFALLLFIFVVCMFWQRCYFMWLSWIICYAYGISMSETKYLKQ